MVSREASAAEPPSEFETVQGAAGKPPAEKSQENVAAHCGLEGEDSIEVSLQCGQMNHSCDPRSISEDVEGVWQMERTDTWYANVASSRLVNDFDGQEVRVPDH